MKVHPAPRTLNITFRYDVIASQKKLRRLPHIFAKVLELPFQSDADVLIQETPDSLRFVVTTEDDIGDDIRAHTIEIYPGVTKIVVRGANVVDLSIDAVEFDVWRFRLPAETRPELASAAFNDGELVVTVPKGDEEGREEVWGEGNGRLVLVQLKLFSCTRIVDEVCSFLCGCLTTTINGGTRCTWRARLPGEHYSLNCGR